MPSILQRMPTKDDPPTYNRTTKVSSAFQGMVDAYGIANYREVNPGKILILNCIALNNGQ